MYCIYLGQYTSCVMNHEHASLRNLQLLISKGALTITLYLITLNWLFTCWFCTVGAHDHRMDMYVAALRGTKTALKFRESSDPTKGSSHTHTTTSVSTVSLTQKLDWATCYLCGLDTSWPYVTHSDATRALVTHRCMNCSRVVCSVCAPAKDILPGEGT
jgi:hypothetical protein